jgi:hypothetical protein
MTGLDLLLMAAVVIGAYVVYDYLQTRDRWFEDEYERRLQERDQDDDRPRSIRELVNRGKP